MPESTILDIKTGSIIKILVMVLAFVFLYLLRDVIVILFFAIVIASAVHPLVNWLEEKRVPRLLAVLLLYLVLATLLAVFFSLIIPIVAFEMTQLGQALPRIFSGLSEAIEGAQSSGYFNFLSDLQGALESSSQF